MMRGWQYRQGPVRTEEVPFVKVMGGAGPHSS